MLLPSPRRVMRPKVFACRPRLEALEGRALPSTVAWLHPVGGDWDTPANWAGGRVPTAADTAVIPFAGITVTHARAASDAVRSLNSEAILDLSAGSLTLGVPPPTSTTATSRIDALFSVSGGSLTLDNVLLVGRGTLVNSATLTIAGSTLDVALQNNAGVLTANSLTSTSGRPFANGPNATLLVPGGANFRTAFTNQGTIRLGSVNGNGSVLGVGSGTLVNAPGATIDFLAIRARSGPSTLGANFDNQGTVLAEGGASIGGNGGTVTNEGQIDVTGRNVSVGPSAFTNTGTITIGSVLTVSGGTFDQNGDVGGSGTLTLSGTTAKFTGDVSNAVTGLVIQNSTFTTTGTLTNVGSMNVGGSTIDAPLVNRGTLMVLGSGTAGEVTAFNGTFTNAAGATLVVEGPAFQPAGTLTIAQGFTNQGTIQLTSVQFTNTSATLTVTEGTLTNAPGATITALMGGNGGFRFLNAQLVNQGTLTVSQETFLTGSLTNSGTIDVRDADLTVTLAGGATTFVNTGNLSVGSLQAFTLRGGDFANAGTVTVGSFGALLLDGGYTQTDGTTSLGGGVLSAGGLVDIEGGVLAGPGVIDGDLFNNAEVDVGGATTGTLTVNGNYTQTAAAVLRVRIGGLTPGDNFDQLNVTGAAALDGTLTVNLVNGFAPSSGDGFAVVTFASGSGVFASIDGDGPRFTPSYNATDVTLVAN